jgi:hypothetical protein
MARGAVLGAVAFTAATVLIGLLLAGCGVSLHADAGTPVGEEREDQSSAGSASPRSVAVISEQHGPSWSGELGDTVQIDWYDRHTGETTSERVAILLVKRFPDPEDDGGPDEFGDSVGPYEWKYGIKVRLTSLDERASRQPLAYQLLQLRDGHDSEDGIVGLGLPGGPDPSRRGRSSVGWLYQRAEQGFTPAEVTLPVGAWRATWSLR